MNTILKSVNPADLLIVSNIRTTPPMPDGKIDPDLAELVESVRTFGVMQPITARREGSKLRVIYGHRRAEAAKIAKLPTVPVLVQDVPSDEIIARQLIENIQRQDLDLADTATAVRKLHDEHKVTAVVAEMVGKSTTWVSKMLTVTAPGKSSHAQHLLKCDRLHDLDLAYLLCRLESLDMAAADDAAHRLFHDLAPKVTRESLAAAIKKASEPEPEDDEDDQAETKATKTALPHLAKRTIELTDEERRMLRTVLDQATVAPQTFATKIGLLTKLRD